MKKKRLLVCGATGFIGRNLVEHFCGYEEWDVIGVYHKTPHFEFPNLKWVQADLTNHEDVNRVVPGHDVVVQAAAITSGAKDIIMQPERFITANAVMNSMLLQAIFEYSIKHFMFFSCTVMLQSSSIPLREEDFDANAQMLPEYFGGAWNKVYIEKMCEFFSRMGKTKFTILRHSNIYGPYDKFDLDHSHVFGATVTKVLNAQDGVVRVWGKGEEGRDLLYVTDLVDFVSKAITQQEGAFELFNVGSGRATKIKDLVRMIIELSGRKLRIEFDHGKPTLNTTICLNCEKANQYYSWKPKIALEEGIEKTINWYREHIAIRA